MNDLNLMFDNGVEAIGRYYSFYLGQVIDGITDYPILLVSIPTIQSTCRCIPWSMGNGQQWGRKDPPPVAGDNVWVMFQAGDVSNAYWAPASWFNKEDVPLDFESPEVWGMVSPTGIKFLVNEFTGDVTVYTGGNIYVNSDKQIIFNQGENMGMVKIQELTDKINNLVQELETLRSTFNSHTHPGVQSGPGTTSPTLNQASQPFTQFNKDDYENTKILQ